MSISVLRSAESPTAHISLRSISLLRSDSPEGTSVTPENLPSIISTEEMEQEEAEMFLRSGYSLLEIR